MASIRVMMALGLVVTLSACSQAPRTSTTSTPATPVAPQLQPVAETPTRVLGGQEASIAPASNTVTSDNSTGEYRIGVDDKIQISVWRNPDLSVEVPVRPDGFVSAPLIGDVRAGGLTAEQVAKNIEAKLEQFIRQPKVSVILTDLVSHQFLNRVRVTGAINQPTSLPYRQGMTILDLVLEAGGLSDFAVPARARLYRKNEQSAEASALKIRLDHIIYKGDLSTNVELKAGDVLTIPERRF